jgi:transketolase
LRTPTTRRRALAWSGAAAAGLLAGCSNTDAPSGSSGTEPAESTAAARRAAARIREAATRTSADLLAHYDAVRKKHPAEADRLKPLRDEVARQAQVLRGPTGRAVAGSAPVTVAAEPKAAVKELADAARRASDAQLAAVDRATPELARLLASVAASGAVHVYLLTDGSPK